MSNPNPHAVVVATFAARFNRSCARCGIRIKAGRHVYRLANGEMVCNLCARRAHR